MEPNEIGLGIGSDTVQILLALQTGNQPDDRLTGLGRLLHEILQEYPAAVALYPLPG